MCSIVGIKGNLNINSLNKMLKLTKHRGPDSTGIYLYGDKEILEKDYKFQKIKDNFNIALGHNLLSIYKSLDNDEDNLNNNKQPFQEENLTLIFNGEIYNCDEIKKELNITTPLSDGQTLLKLIHTQTQNNKLSKETIQKIIKKLDGDYAFAITDNEKIILARDPIGIKPLYYTIDNNLRFSSEPKTLKQDYQTLKPGHILYENKQYLTYNIFEDTKESNKTYNKLKENIIKTLYTSVYNRVSNLDKVGLLCSGGIDSAFIAYILKNISTKKPLDIKLYSVGNKNSKDITYSKKIAENLNLPLKIQEVNTEIIQNNIKDVIIAIEDTNRMKLGVATTIYLATKQMKQDKIKVGLTGQGADELFAGYNRYIKHIKEEKPENLKKELIHDLKNIHHVNLERDDAASMKNSIELRHPYLSNNLIKLALKIPIKYKIKTKEDNLKKHILRDAAIDYGIPAEIAKRPKKAAQYGSGIDKILKKKIEKELDFNEILTDFYKNI